LISGYRFLSLLRMTLALRLSSVVGSARPLRVLDGMGTDSTWYLEHERTGDDRSPFSVLRMSQRFKTEHRSPTGNREPVNRLPGPTHPRILLIRHTYHVERPLAVG
jgi:hypothetical protein